jgi:DnaJ-class molecular chaperone
MSDDYYQILNISRNASSADIQKAYRDAATPPASTIRI